jgi:phytoene dehydrogenase-like protein
MLLCPVMYYGNAEEHDMDFTAFVTLFKSILLEGFARPPDGVRTIVKTLVRKFRGCGGTIRMSCGVERLLVEGDRVVAVRLPSGEECTAETVLSSAGFFETMSLCSDAEDREPNEAEAGRLSFVETIAVSSDTPVRLGHEATIVFFNDAERFTYARPDDPVDLRSGVFCCPNNYEGHEGLPEGQFRLTWLANYERWANLNEATYAEAKRSYQPLFFERVEQYVPGLRERTSFVDMFTPRTIRHYTGHRNGAVYGAPRKIRDGRTRLNILFLCGTDQGYLGIVGAMLSGITMANVHVLSRD